jgi:Zn-dependent protease
MSAILTFVFTVAVFFAVGSGERGWQPLLLIAGILFFHELGHLIAMWQFRYRNLRMFFIPFFGAAVSGQNYNVPGWKKAMVSLMGPLPGIVLGAALGIVAAVYHWPAITSGALLLLAINAFNLLPIMPLDGGQIAHAILFSRHPTLDVAFRATAALLLILSGLAGMRFFALIGISMLVGLPMTYRVGKVVRRLRKSAFDASSHDAQTIPMETARAIHSELKGALPAQSNTKTSATLTLRAFELLNARPPGWLASCALLGVHGLTLLVAVVAIIALILIRHGGFRDIAMSALLDRSKHAVDSSRILTWSGAKASQAERKGSITISADFSSREHAEAAYRNLTAKLPPEAAATAFGETVLVTLPAGDKEARERWSQELRGRGENVFVHDKATPLALMLTCSVPTVEAAEELENEIKEYVDLPSAMHLIPPWSPDRPISAAERKARRTFVAIQNHRWGDADDPRRDTMQKELADAVGRDDVPATKRATRQLEQLRQTLHKEHLDRMRREGGSQWDVALIDQYEKSPEPGRLDPPEDGETKDEQANDEPAKRNAAANAKQEEWEQWAIEFGSRLGQLPMEGKIAAAGANRMSAQFGTVNRVGSTIYINVCLECPSTGAAALAHWLSRRGCKDLKYDFCPDEQEGD